MSDEPPEYVAVRLVEAAAAILGSVGPAGLTLRAVAAEAGTSTMSVYSRFGSMPGLVRATLTEADDRLAAKLRDVPQTDDPLFDLIAVGVAYLENARASPTLYAVMTGAAPLGKYAADAVPRPSAAQNVATLVDAVRRAEANVVLAPSSVEAFTAQLLAAMHGFVLYDAGGLYPADGAVDIVLAPLMKALCVMAGADSDAFDAAVRRALTP